MQSFADAWNRIETFLLSGVAGSEFTPLRLLTVITLTLALFWVTRRITRWFVENVLARRGFDIGMREAVGAIVRYIIITLGISSSCRAPVSTSPRSTSSWAPSA